MRKTSYMNSANTLCVLFALQNIGHHYYADSTKIVNPSLPGKFMSEWAENKPESGNNFRITCMFTRGTPICTRHSVCQILGVLRQPLSPRGGIHHVCVDAYPPLRVSSRYTREGQVKCPRVNLHRENERKRKKKRKNPRRSTQSLKYNSENSARYFHVCGIKYLGEGHI